MALEDAEPLWTPFVEADPEWAGLYAFLLVVVLLAGLILHGLGAWISARLLTTKDRSLLWCWYKERTEYPEEGWQEAQAWIWSHAEASDEFGGLRTQIVLHQGSAVVALLATLSCLAAVFLSGVLPWLPLAAAGGLGVLAFGCLWLRANRLYHGLVRDAAKIGPPTAAPHLRGEPGDS